ncbi:MAG: prepilin-type N-terminal cleavage/methylation domain-containing protein [Acidobacteria bacterium]|nr:prepilin-type N-terminal cleavage/methylation domain-containing protein [Acidobacteriota bacterium]
MRQREPPLPSCRPAPCETGFTLVETLVAMFVTTLILLSVAQLMITSLYVHRSATDLTETTALSSERLEQMRNTQYDLLLPGGSIAVNAAGFWENLDINGDGVNDYARRWEVLDLGDRKEIRVRTMSLLSTMGPPKETTLHQLVAPE